MATMWGALLPLIIGSALVPIQIVVTILLLRSSPRTALAWVGGMTTVRLVQGLLFGLVLGSAGTTETSTSSGPGPVLATLLLVLAVVFYVTAFRTYTTEDDPDGPPPKWMTMTESLTPLKASLVGGGLLAIGAKFWVFTLGAVGAIADAGLGRTSSVLTFLLFVALAEIVHLTVIGIAFVVPARSAAILDAMSAWLIAHNRLLVIVLGVVFGTWFLVKALTAFHVL